jgi:hypothetical protein
LDLILYWVIFKLLTFLRWLWDPGLQVWDFLGESAMYSPTWWQRCFAVSACVLGRWLGFLRDDGFLIISFGFYLRDLLPILMESVPADADIVFIYYSGLYYHVFIFIIILFILCWFIYLFHLVFRTHVSSCICDGIVTPNLI